MGKKKPPEPHFPEEQPDGALYIGYIAKNKEYLYTQDELDMLDKLKGTYVGIPSDDPYAKSYAQPIEINIEADPRDKVVYNDDQYQYGAINSNVPKPNFSKFRNIQHFLNQVTTEGAKPAAKRATSISEIKILDLISEGEIEGLVDYEYKYTVDKLGQIGYTSASKEFKPIVTLDGKQYRYLQSINLNGVPIVDQDGLFNFQQVDINVTNGKPQGDENGVESSLFGVVENISDEPLQVVRRIGERLRGPNKRNGAPPSETQPSYFSKFYKILNPNCDGVKIIIRIDTFIETNTTGSRYRDDNYVQGKGYGDRGPVQAAFGASFRKIFANKTPEAYSASFDFTIVAKITTGFLYEFRMPFYKDRTDLESPDFQGYEIKITRYTPDSVLSTVSSASTIDAIVEIYHQKFTYPNSAIVSAKFNSEYFTQIPERSYDVRLLKVKIPSNYDPITKTYNRDGSTDWDGLFRENKEWTNNPAWCYYDLLTNKRYGLGDQLKEEDIDKWSIYELSKYCDEMVSDGEGGFEPRYVCNVRLTEKSDAFNALRNFSSIFRGFTYYMGGSISCTFDSRKDLMYTFTNANVKEGSFNYQGSSSQSRGNVFLVRYNDENNFYEPAIEYLEDPVAIKRNGVIQKDINAFGCTKKSYALRYATWMKESENTELETVNFKAGVESMLLRPGDNINISDRNRSSRRLGGRIFELFNSGSSASVTLDSVIPLTGNVNYNFSLITPTFNLEPSLIRTGIAVTGGNNIFVGTGESGGLSSHFTSGIRKPHVQSKTFTTNNLNIITGEDGSERTRIIFNSAFDQTGYLISGRNPFYISSDSTLDQIKTKLYRIIGIKEDNTNEYSISALEVNNEKYNVIDSGVAVLSLVALPPTPGLSLTEVTLLTENDDIETPCVAYQITPPTISLNCRSYSVFVKKDAYVNSDFSQGTVSDAPPDSKYLIDTIPVAVGREALPLNLRYYVPDSNGTYHFRVYSRNTRGQPCSVPAEKQIMLEKQKSLINLVSINSLAPIDPLSFGSALDSNLNSESQKTIDLTKSGNSAGAKIKIGPLYQTAYGNLGVNELINMAKEPRVSWQVSLPSFSSDKQIKIGRDALFYRISAREPSPTNAPSKYIYFEITGFSNGEGGQSNLINAQIGFNLNHSGKVRVSNAARTAGLYPLDSDYKFPTTGQLKGSYSSFYNDFSGDYIDLSSPNTNLGPFRNYDIVVEATDINNNSSAGYNILQKEELNGDFWNLSRINTLGFDILEIRNPKPAQTILTPQFRLGQGIESIFPGSDPQLIRKNGYFTNEMYGSAANPLPSYTTQSDIDNNYATLKLLGAASEEPTFCVTEQYMNQQGDFTLKIRRDARGFVDPSKMIDYRDAVMAIVFYSDTWFNINTVKNRAADAGFGFQANILDDSIYTLGSYTENKPKGDKITSLSKINWNPTGAGNSDSYLSTVNAKVFNLPDEFVENQAFIFDLNVNTKKYISVAFLDAIDAGTDDITRADDPDLAVLKKSKVYNFSPTAFVNIKGETDKRASFRAYGLFKISCTTLNKSVETPRQYGSTFPVGTFPPKKLSSKYLYIPGLLFAEDHLTYARPSAFETPYPAYYYPNKVRLDLYSYGVAVAPAVLNITDSNGAIGFRVTFQLDQPIPIHNRILFFGGGVRKSLNRNVEDSATTLSVVVNVPSLQQPPQFSFSKRRIGTPLEWLHRNNNATTSLAGEDAAGNWGQWAGYFQPLGFAGRGRDALSNPTNTYGWYQNQFTSIQRGRIGAQNRKYYRNNRDFVKLGGNGYVFANDVRRANTLSVESASTPDVHVDGTAVGLEGQVEVYGPPLHNMTTDYGLFDYYTGEELPHHAWQGTAIPGNPIDKATFERLYKITSNGSNYTYESPDSSYFALLSNGETASEILVSEIKDITSNNQSVSAGKFSSLESS